MKLEAAALALSAVSLAGLLFAVSEARSASSGIGALSDRVAKIESASPVPRGSAAGPSNADLAREIAALRVQISSLSIPPPSTGWGPAAKPPLEPLKGEEAAKLSAADEEKRQQARLDGLSRSIVRNLTEKLELSSQQQTLVSDLVRVQLASYRQSQLGKSAEDSKESLEALLAETNEKMKHHLTMEQRSKYDEIANRPGGIFTASVTLNDGQPVDGANGASLQPK